MARRQHADQLGFAFPEPGLKAETIVRAAIPVAQVDPAPVSEAQVMAMNAMTSMFAPGSFESMYRRITNARWGSRSSRCDCAVIRFEMFDGLRAEAEVTANYRDLRVRIPTGDSDWDGDPFYSMANLRHAWMSLRWKSMEGGPCCWDADAMVWQRIEDVDC
jgi:hypothetical protein